MGQLKTRIKREGRKKLVSSSKKPSLEELFYNYPIRLFHIREISRLTGIPKSTVAIKVKRLIKEGIVREDKDIFKAFRSNDSGSKYRTKKMLYALEQIYGSGVVDFLHETFMPTFIILFGSMRKGEYTAESDIDIFICASEEKVDLSVYEEKLGKPIQTFFSNSLNDVPANLRNNIANGIVLSGYVKFF